MIQHITIRAEFLIDDLRKIIITNNEIHPLIAKAWKNDIRYLIVNGMEGENEQIYDFYDKNDLKDCIDMGLDAEDIAYLVHHYRENNDNTSFFTYNNTKQMYGLHILSKSDVLNSISKQIENIAYNILKYPYKEVYADLYKEFVVPMIEQQIA